MSEVTAARILKAAADLKYVSHGVARALTTRSTRTIGAVIPTLDNAIYAVSTHALERRLQKAGYMLVVASHEFDLDAEARAVEALISRGVDGVALVGFEHRNRTLELLTRSAVPYVLMWNYHRRKPRSIGFDNEAAAVMAGEYLLKLGHRRFGMIAGVLAGNDRACARMRGLKAALSAAGLSLDDRHAVQRPYTFEGGANGLRALLSAEPRPTAVVCGNDVLAIGAIREAGLHRLNVPKDLSIMGFDDMPLAEICSPALTTVHFPMEEIGEQAGAYLLQALEKSIGKPVRELPFRLVVRASAGAPP